MQYRTTNQGEAKYYGRWMETIWSTEKAGDETTRTSSRKVECAVSLTLLCHRRGHDHVLSIPAPSPLKPSWSSSPLYSIKSHFSQPHLHVDIPLISPSRERSNFRQAVNTTQQLLKDPVCSARLMLRDLVTNLARSSRPGGRHLRAREAHWLLRMRMRR